MGVEQLRAALTNFQTETNNTLKSMQSMIQVQAEQQIAFMTAATTASAGGAASAGTTADPWMGKRSGSMGRNAAGNVHDACRSIYGAWNGNRAL